MAVLLGVGASERDVGVLDLDTGVVDFSFYNIIGRDDLESEFMLCNTAEK